MRLAEFLARRFQHRGEQLDDLRQVALVGLLKAVERFDPERGLQFSSFATPTIVGELKRHFRDKGWAVRVPRGAVQELHLELDHTVASLTQELRRPPSTAEIAERAGAWEEDVIEAMEANSLYRLPSIDAARTGDDARARPTSGSAPMTKSSMRSRTASRCATSCVCPSANARSCTCASSRAGRSRRSPGRRHQPDARLPPVDQEPRNPRRAACADHRAVMSSPLDRELPLIDLAVTGPTSEPTLHVDGEIDVATAPQLR